MLILAKRGNIKWPPMNKCSPFLRFKSAAIVDGGFSIYASIAKLGILQCSSIWLSGMGGDKSPSPLTKWLVYCATSRLPTRSLMWKTPATVRADT